MDIAIHIINALISIVAVVIALRKRHDAKEAAFNRKVDEALACAKAKPQPGIPEERVALEWAILSDMADNGKRDFTDGQFLAAIRARRK